MAHLEELTRFITEFRGKGHFLPYEDIEVVKNWATLSNGLNPDKVILLLAELLEPYQSDSKPVSLRAIDKKFQKKIQVLRQNS